MHGAFEHIEELPAPDRRIYSRQPVRTIAYVELDEGNGGIILNASEGGLSVQAVMSVMEDSLPRMRFRLSQSKDWFETAARVVWASESRKVAGLEFVDLPEETRLHIREWLAAAAGLETPSEAPLPSERQFPVVQEPDARVTLELFTSLPASTSEPTPFPVASASTHSFGQASESEASSSSASGAWPGANAKRYERAWNVAGWIAILAILSLLAGWAAGRGTLNSPWENLRAMVSPSKAAQSNVASPVSSPTVPVSQIETVDVSNQHWTIPFGSPTNSSPTGFREQTSQSAPPSKWPTSDPALATPQIQSLGRDAASQQPNPPAIGESSGNSASISLPSQSIDPREIAPPPSGTAPQASSLRRGVLIYHVNPIYPDLAKDQGIQGTVELEAIVGTDGLVRSVKVLGGPRLLIAAARSAVVRWRYTPSLLNGKPVEAVVDVSVVFHLPSSP